MMASPINNIWSASAPPRPASWKNDGPARGDDGISEKRLRRRRLRYCYAGAAALALLLLGAGVLWHESTRGWTPGAVERLAKAVCPPQTPRTQVEAWLASEPFPPEMPAFFQLFHKRACPWQGHRLEYEYHDSAKGIEYLWREMGLNPDDTGGCIVARIPDPNVDLFSPGTITLIFFFDRDDQLIKQYVRVWLCP